MDTREHPDHDSAGEGADEQMQMETDPSSDTTHYHEIQMTESGADFNDIGASNTQHTSINVTVPAHPTTSTLSSETLSSALQRTSVRRNRVEDDHDDDRDRRHPSERLSSPSHSANATQQPNPLVSTPLHNSPHTPEPTAPAAQHLSTPGNSRLNPFHFFRHILSHSLSNPSDTNPTPANASLPLPTGLLQQDGATLDPSTQTPVAAAVSPTAFHDGRWQLPLPWTTMGPHHLGGFTITIDANGNSTTTPLLISPNVSATQGHASPPTGSTAGVPSIPNVQAPQEDVVPGAHRQEGPTPQQPQGTQMPRDTQTPLNHTLDGASIADIFARIGLFAALSLRDLALLERDADDPERARKLVDGLEDVPIGLIRRLERVGKADLNNEHEHHSEDGIETSLGDNGCTICWEPLLLEDEESEQGNATVKGNEKTHEHGLSTDHQELPTHAQIDVGVSSSVSDSQKKRHYCRIVTLPCAHAFHADCLIPWFSKPKQTTCPICRFNIDPENLTYTIRAQRMVPPHFQTPQNDGGSGTNVTTSAPVNSESRTVPVADLNVDISSMSPREGIQDRNAESNPGVFIYTGDPSGVVENAGVNGEQNQPSDMFTIGFEMYIEHGPPPFLLGGPNLFQAPVPGPQNNGNNTAPFPLPISMVGVPVNATGSDATHIMSQGNIPTGNAHPSTGIANTGGPSGDTAAVPPEAGPGTGFTLADIVTRIVSGDLLRRVNVTAPGGQTEQGGPTQNHIGPQGPGSIPFGPERPPAVISGGIPEPARSEVIAGLQRARMQNIPAASLISPSGNYPGMMSARGVPQQSRRNLRSSGGTQPAPNTGPGGLPTFNVAFGSFGGPAPPDQGQGQEPRADLRASDSNAQPAQPRPWHLPGQGQEGFGFLSFAPDPPAFRPTSAPAPRQPVPRKKWAPPPPPGLTLRQKVEKREQEVGLRCCDVSCGVGPSDEDPWVHATEHGLKQLNIRASPRPSVDERMMAVDGGVELNRVSGENGEVANDVDTGRDLERKSVCPHMFHSSCLVSSERVSLALRDAQVTFVGPEGYEEVEVSCPVCRGSGRVSKEEWDAGIEALGEPGVA